MIPHICHFKGLGWLAGLGIGLIMATEIILRGLIKDPSVMAPRSWWLISGYAVAAAYCIILHFVLRFLDARDGLAGRQHSLMSVPVQYWSIFYLVIGVARVYSPK